MKARIEVCEFKDGSRIILPPSSGSLERISYTRDDLVDRLKGYAVHHPNCAMRLPFTGVNYCTCGLTEVLKEIE